MGYAHRRRERRETLVLVAATLIAAELALGAEIARLLGAW